QPEIAACVLADRRDLLRGETVARGVRMEDVVRCTRVGRKPHEAGVGAEPQLASGAFEDREDPSRRQTLRDRIAAPDRWRLASGPGGELEEALVPRRDPQPAAPILDDVVDEVIGKSVGACVARRMAAGPASV